MSESFLVKVDDELYGWGWNEHGNLGVGDKVNKDIP
jgi:alpha-tubulin suppressor-like RCC1 family protein